MRHHTAAQESEGGGWHYASIHPRRGGYPLGYCVEHEPHATEAEARECYGRWQRDHVRIDGKCSWGSCSIRGCPNPSNRYADIQGDAYSMTPLCEEHLTVEHAIIAMQIEGPAGDAWVS